VVSEDVELHLHRAQDLSYHNGESELAEPTNAAFLTKTIRILSGIGPRNALLIEFAESHNTL
jgi:hypothetical protein